MHRRAHSGFTLIELLTVIGLIVLLAGAAGVVLHARNSAVALETAQTTLAGLLQVARGQAIQNQSRAMLLIDAEAGNTRFLRTLHVALETAPASGQWRITADVVVLPPGIFVVPGNEPLPGAVFAVAEGGADWPDGRRSTLSLTARGSIAVSAENPSGTYLGMLAPLTVAGTAERNRSDKLVVAAARQAMNTVIFDRPDSVRGVAVSAYGASILINDGAELDF